ncbi:hypothetical protein HAX54_002459 [Datura stramonium]|uniref:B3 domain-containing protein n=1 Tax=Datura stramonium TaxID=4076 RepID=A0ABS8RWB6_DATST|nr:hypothetical protein [Datura stramonium]
MVYTMLSLEDFLGAEFMAHRSSPMDYLLFVSEVAWLKSLCGEEDNLIAEQDEQFRVKKQQRITHNIRSILSSSPQLLLDHQETSVPRGKRSVPNARPRKNVAERFFSNGGGEFMMIKKAVEEQHRADDDRGNRVFEIDGGVGVNNQEFFQENRVKGVHDDGGNRVLKINWKGSGNFAFENPKRQLPIIRKRSRQVAAANDPSEATRKKKKRNVAVVRVEAPPVNVAVVRVEAPPVNVAVVRVEAPPVNVAVARVEAPPVNVAVARVEAPPVNVAVARVEAPPVVMINRELDIEFKNLITELGGSLESIKLVIEKRLFQTDVKPGEGRLSIPQKQCGEFLEPEEDARLNTRNGLGKMCEMRVMLIEPSLQRSEINLRKWFMNKDNGKTSLSYVLVTYWNDVVRRNALKNGTKVQLWAFRKGPDLCFALVKLQN